MQFEFGAMGARQFPIFARHVLAKNFKLIVVEVVSVKQSLFKAYVVPIRIDFTKLIRSEVQTLRGVSCGFRIEQQNILQPRRRSPLAPLPL